MKVLDTDTLTLLFQGHEKVVARRREETEDVVIALATRIEVLQGRFATLLKAATGEELLRGQRRLEQAERDLAAFAVLVVSDAAAAEFDRLLLNKAVKKIGRGDLLIAAITLANLATLAPRNVKDFKKVPGLRVENWAD